MTASTPRTLFFENPNSIFAGVPINITWGLGTFGAVNDTHFLLNIWILHADNRADDVVNSHVPVLLASKTSVYSVPVIR